MIRLAAFVPSLPASALAPWAEEAPWALTANAPAIVEQLLAAIEPAHYRREGTVAVHHTATIEPGAVLKGPAIVGPGSFVAAGAYVRGGCWLEAGCILGPGAELKSSFVLWGAKLAHFNFVGDSILGTGVNLEAGSIVANCRNERPEKEIRVRVGGRLKGTGIEKFGALLGDEVRIGANAVVAPGALVPAGFVLPRLALLDQEKDAP